MRGLVSAFVAERFPMVLLLNKADQGGETDRHIQRIIEKFEPRNIPCVVGSAAAEVFLKNAKKKKFIKYLEVGAWVCVEEPCVKVEFKLIKIKFKVLNSKF